MDLENLYQEVHEAIASLDFERIWPGFSPLKFALYDDEKCFFDGRFVEKTDAFMANTSIVYEGEQIAIWKVQEELEIPVLTSKIVHEMFHGFQTQKGWTCWPDEMEALYRYAYQTENLSLKLRENELLLKLMDHFDEASYRESLAHRKLRSEKYPYEFSYECKVEEIEGTANYVEWQVLRQLDADKAAALTEHMCSVMTRPEYLFPIRISSYYTGALAIHAMLQADAYEFETAERPVMLEILKNIEPSDGTFPGEEMISRKVTDAVDAFNQESERIIQSALEKNEVVLTGPLELVFVNIYNARCYKGYITSTFFLMARDSAGDKMLQGNFVIRMKDEKTIDTVYRWEQ